MLFSAFTTVSDSFFRIKPLSIWIHFTLSFPIALKHSAARTLESMPPETKTSTLPVGPTCSWISLIQAISRASGVKLQAKPDKSTKFWNIFCPFSVRSTSGWNWTPKMFLDSFEIAVVRLLLRPIMGVAHGITKI